MAGQGSSGVSQRMRGGLGGGEEEEEDDEDSSTIDPLFDEYNSLNSPQQAEVEDDDLSEKLRDLSTNEDAPPRNSNPDESPRKAALEKFREQWREELEGKQSRRGVRGVNERSSSVKSSRGESPETRHSPAVGDVRQEDFEKARTAFLQGIEQEKMGQMLEAVRCYNRAIHIVPEIEWLIFSKGRSKANKSNVPICLSSETSSGHQTPLETERPDKDLMNVFVDRLYSKKTDQFTLCEAESLLAPSQMHVSNLPVEVLFNIFRWIIGPELDMRSLEQISYVSAGFYILCRDPELWRLVCIRTWGLRSCGSGDIRLYPEWRGMFIERPHVWHNGVYISRITYIRHGETSYQDQFYRPWHLVAYYRFLRFFANGEVLMLTTPDEPSMVVPNIRYHNSRYPGVLRGRFLYSGPDLISLSFHRHKKHDSSHVAQSSHFNRKKRTAISGHEPVEHIFDIELRINHLRRKRHSRLEWVSYDLKTKKMDGTETQTDFDLNETSFPPYYYSRVKSYSAICESPLK